MTHDSGVRLYMVNPACKSAYGAVITAGPVNTCSATKALLKERLGEAISIQWQCQYQSLNDCPFALNKKTRATCKGMCSRVN